MTHRTVGDRKLLRNQMEGKGASESGTAGRGCVESAHPRKPTAVCSQRCAQQICLVPPSCPAPSCSTKGGLHPPLAPHGLRHSEGPMENDFSSRLLLPGSGVETSAQSQCPSRSSVSGRCSLQTCGEGQRAAAGPHHYSPSEAIPHKQ